VTTLPDRPNTALVVIDMQNGAVREGHEVDKVVANINTLVDKARAEGVPVVWVQHNDDDMPVGSDSWQYHADLQWTDDETVVHKSYNDSFEDTVLEDVLAENGVGRLIVTGAQTDACVRATLHGALVRGYDTVLVGDAHTTEDMRPWGAPFGPADAIAYTNLYWKWSVAPGRTGGVVDTSDVEFAP
jgi:nicotinamidase-related amidase